MRDLPNPSLIDTPELVELLTAVRDACLYTDDGNSGDYIGVTTEPHISEELFARICDALNKARGAS